MVSHTKTWFLGITLRQQGAFPVSQVTSFAQGSPDCHMTYCHLARSLSPRLSPPFLFLFWQCPLFPWRHPADLTLLPTPQASSMNFPQFLLSNGVKSPCPSLLFIPLSPPPPLLQGLNPLSVPAGSLNYSVERRCSPQRAMSETLSQKEGR